jgi:hypothetical protein
VLRSPVKWSAIDESLRDTGLNIVKLRFGNWLPLASSRKKGAQINLFGCLAELVSRESRFQTSLTRGPTGRFFCFSFLLDGGSELQLLKSLSFIFKRWTKPKRTI